MGNIDKIKGNLDKAREQYESIRIECEQLAANRRKVYHEIEQKHRAAMEAELREAAGDLNAALEMKAEASRLVTRLEREMEESKEPQSTATEAVRA